MDLDADDEPEKEQPALGIAKPEKFIINSIRLY